MMMKEEHIKLVAKAQSGDIKSFERLYAIYYEKIYALARIMLRNETDAENVLQETFITAWRKLNTLEEEQAFSVWIQVIAKNICNMQLRAKSKTILLDIDNEAENIDAEDTDDEFFPAAYAERA